MPVPWAYQPYLRSSLNLRGEANITLWFQPKAMDITSLIQHQELEIAQNYNNIIIGTLSSSWDTFKEYSQVRELICGLDRCSSA